MFTLGPGRMLGVLLATETGGRQHVLKAFSGQMTESWHIPGWVGPVAGVINESHEYIRHRTVIEALSVRLHRLDQQRVQEQQQPLQTEQQQHNEPVSVRLHKRQEASSVDFRRQQRQLLKRRRRAVSHHLLQRIQQSYSTSTVGSGQPLSLLDVHLSYRELFEPELPVTKAGSFVGMPAGVGDCCAPKLLHAAVQRGLTPVAMCEVWFGSAPGTATKAKQGREGSVTGMDANSSRQHCQLYGPCDKCRAILGTMLCGCDGRAVSAGV